MHVIEIGPQTPRRRNRFLAGLGNAVLRLFGWHIEVRLPDLPRFVMIAVPHTSNWDFVFGISAIFLMEVPVRWWVKHTVYRWPFRGLIDWLGGIPINRKAAHGVVGETVAFFREHPQVVLGIAPEGTRQRVGAWKRGFYHVARAADVPIVLAYIDYRRKVVGTGPVVHPTGDYAADVAPMLEYFRDVTPRHPEQYGHAA